MKSSYRQCRLAGLLVAIVLSPLASGSANDAKNNPSANLHVVLIGINNYQTAPTRVDPPAGQSRALEFPNLKYAAQDVVAIRDSLIALGASPDQIHMFADIEGGEVPSLVNVKQRLESLETTTDQTLLFMFCGHGLNIEEESILCFPESIIHGNETSGNLAADNALTVSELSNYLADIEAGFKIIVTDACRNYSSEVAGYAEEDIQRYDLSKHIRNLKENSGANQVMIVSSCLPKQVSQANEEAEHGLFTSQLLEALKGRADFEGPGNRDGLLSVNEIFHYAASKTRQISIRDIGYAQSPYCESGFYTECHLVALDDDVRADLAGRYNNGDFFVAPLGLAEQMITESYQEAIGALYVGDNDLAIGLCTDILETNPNHKPARRLRSMCLAMQGDLTEAIDGIADFDPDLTVRVPKASRSTALLAIDNVRNVVEVLKPGDLVKLTQVSKKWNEKERGHFVRCQSVKSKGSDMWREVDGWIVSSNLKPASAEDQLDLLRQYQYDNNQPVTDYRGGGTAVSRMRYNPYVSTGSTFEQAIGIYMFVRGITDGGGIPYVPYGPSLHGITPDVYIPPVIRPYVPSIPYLPF